MSRSPSFGNQVRERPLPARAADVSGRRIWLLVGRYIAAISGQEPQRAAIPTISPPGKCPLRSMHRVALFQFLERVLHSGEVVPVLRARSALMNHARPISIIADTGGLEVFPDEFCRSLRRRDSGKHRRRLISGNTPDASARMASPAVRGSDRYASASETGAERSGAATAPPPTCPSTCGCQNRYSGIRSDWSAAALPPPLSGLEFM